MITPADEIDEEVSEENSEEVLPFKYSITSYGADYPVDGLVKRLKNNDISIPTFQRSFIWTLPQASRFVESLLLGLPVPGIFLSKEQNSQKLLVIDGQQRLKTLLYFYDGIFSDSGKGFGLKGVQPQFENLTYKTLEEEDRRRLDDSIIHATIIKQDEPSDKYSSSVYHVFERLNTGGTQLQAQEIRASIYSGEFSDLLKKLNEDKSWRSLYGPESKRMRDQELILRFLALHFKYNEYRKPMIEFLNSYMSVNRHLQKKSAKDFEEVFLPTVKIIKDNIGEAAFRPKKNINAAVLDAVMVGLSKKLFKGRSKLAKLSEQYQALIKDEIFIMATETATTDEENVKKRITQAIRFFS